ncbi:MAG: TIGR03790 family protein, partial [Desulfobacteraceae bacterium]|nr:TIGR03790 family protein [Desulfobacteraceae bacterium]
LEENPRIRAMVTVFGVPLKITGPKNSLEETKQLARLNGQRTALEEQLNTTTAPDPSAPSKRQALQKKLQQAKGSISRLKRNLDKNASFDSELSLVKHETYKLNLWQSNPFYLGFKDQVHKIPKSDVMMVSRLDAASAKIVRRIIDDSIEAEREGLFGTAYFDARWKDPGKKKLSGYAFYDRSIHRAAQFQSKLLPMILNDTQNLFQPGDCPNAALYCGWYSLAKYIDAFQWAKGSVGYHIASNEAATLRQENSQVWCKKMLDNGIAATIGPVGEPYVQAFPVPEIFFNLLTEGYLTLAEAYMVSMPYLSWKMVLIGDPLYRINIKEYKK